MIVFDWITEFLFWLTNAVTYFVPFLEPGPPIDNPIHDTQIVILSPSFTGPILYLREKKYFEKRGFHTHVVNFSSEMRDMETAAPKLKKIIEDLNLKKILLVGVSAAGLVAYEYLNTLKGWDNIYKFVAVATPFKGAGIAYTHFHTKTGRQLVPGSKYIKRISKIKPYHLERTYCVVAKKDELVRRHSSSLPGAHFIEMPIVGHVRLHAYSSQTFETIIKIAKGEID